jgi:DNA-binding MarR family transcriptional regulator
MMQSENRSDPGLATSLRISVSRLARRLRVERAAAGLGEPDLSETQPGELAEHEKVQPPSMTRVISVLVDSQLVRREPHPSDRRQVVLTATGAGRDLVVKARRRREAWLAQRLKELSQAERAALRAAAPILEKLSQS